MQNKTYQELSNELQEATFEDVDHVKFESTNLFKDLREKFETYKHRVSGKFLVVVIF